MKIFAQKGFSILKALYYLTTIGRVFAEIRVVYPTPDTLNFESNVESTLANFGHIDYGTSMLGQVFVPISNLSGCDPFTKEMFTEKGRQALFENVIAMELPMILVDRGNCSFVTKARNIENAGANVALIADDTTEYSELLMMADDGSGHSIHIPSFMLRKETSD